MFVSVERALPTPPPVKKINVTLTADEALLLLAFVGNISGGGGGSPLTLHEESYMRNDTARKAVRAVTDALYHQIKEAVGFRSVITRGTRFGQRTLGELVGVD